MKKLLSPLLALFCLLLASCTVSSGTAVMQTNKSTNTMFSYSHASSSQTLRRELDIKNGDPRTLQVTVETTEGTLDITVQDDNKNILYQGSAVPTSSFSVALDNPGKYTIIVKTNKHKGSFTFDWGT